MASILQKAKRRQESRNGNRFYTARDMAILKHDIAIQNSRKNRGEYQPEDGYEYIAVCGCGVEGCFIHSSTKRVAKEYKKTVHFRHGNGTKN